MGGRIAACGAVLAMTLAFALAACEGDDGLRADGGLADAASGGDAAASGPDGAGAAGPDGGADTWTAPDAGTVADGSSAEDAGTLRPDAVPEDVPPRDDARDDARPDDDAGLPCPTPEALAPIAITGRLYEDGNESARTLYVQTFEDGTDQPLAGVVVRLHESDGVRVGETCGDGTFAFGGLAPGLYVVEPGVPPEVPATSTNRGARFAAALQEGAVHIVAFGDSVPVYSPDPPFPERLGTLLEPLAAVTVTNVAVSGSESWDWLPARSFFRTRLAPQLETADVVVFTLGGNDVLHFLNDVPSSQEEAVQMLAGIRELIGGILDNIETVVAAIRERAPHVDIVYCLYPDYAASAQWAPYLGEFQGLVQVAFQTEMARIRTRMAALDGIVLADLYAATRGTDVTALLIDPLHLSDAGADLYAAEVFQALGGVIVAPDEVVPPRLFGFAPGGAAGAGAAAP